DPAADRSYLPALDLGRLLGPPEYRGDSPGRTHLAAGDRSAARLPGRVRPGPPQRSGAHGPLPAAVAGARVHAPGGSDRRFLIVSGLAEGDLAGGGPSTVCVPRPEGPKRPRPGCRAADSTGRAA